MREASMIRRYYEDELSYLNEAGKEYAKAHPDQARFLNIDSVSDRDPYVERLFEGFAFLTARIRERLDDELSEFTEAMFSLLWPHFLQPMPAFAILQFQPRPGLVQQSTPVPRGTEVRSGPVGGEEVVCRFQTTQEVQLHPLRLRDAVTSWPPDGTSSVTLKFELEKGIEYQQLKLNPLRVFFHAEETIASTMYLFFTRHVTKIVFSTPQGAESTVELRGQQWARAAGLTPGEALVPYPAASFTGHRLLQDYLSFRRKFWFVDLFGLDRFSPPQKSPEFQIQIWFDAAYPEERRFKTENVRLFCTPIVNLFRSDAEPVRIDHTRFEYPIVPEARHPGSVEVHSVDSVVGMEESTGSRHEYHHFYSFQHAGVKEGRYFTTTSRMGPSDRYDTYLLPGGMTPVNGDLPVETLSLELTCTNGTLPREKLQAGMITQPAPDFPNIASFENLTQPTLNLYPPSVQMARKGSPREHFLWKVVSHFAFNFMSVATRDALRGVLELYDWTGTDANRRRIEGLRDVRWQPKEVIHRGSVIRGAEVIVDVQDGHFADEGDLCLFGLVLSEFLSQYASMNSFVHLTLVSKPSEHTYHWEPQRGVLPVL